MNRMTGRINSTVGHIVIQCKAFKALACSTPRMLGTSSSQSSLCFTTPFLVLSACVPLRKVACSYPIAANLQISRHHRKNTWLNAEHSETSRCIEIVYSAHCALLLPRKISPIKVLWPKIARHAQVELRKRFSRRSSLASEIRKKN